MTGSRRDTAPAHPAGHAVAAPGACSVVFDDADAAAYGTAAQARFFLALEQPGPWGRDAATQSHLDRDLGRRLSADCAERGGRFTLLRRPGQHADHRVPAPVTAYLAWAGDDPWMLRCEVDDPATITTAHLDALARGDRQAVARALPGARGAAPVLLVCTNGRRDVCCAVRGRPLAQQAADAAEATGAGAGRVWEASHTGGHRFAPTGVLLPFGATFARLDVELASAILDAADRGELAPQALGPRHDRGRSALERPEQVAESWVRQLIAEARMDALSTVAEPGSAAAGGDDGALGDQPTTALVRHTDGRAWRVTCTPTTGPALPESCGKPAVPVVSWTVEGHPICAG